MGGLLNVDMVLEAAAAQAGTSDFGDALYAPALRALIDAINDDAQIEPPRAWRTGAQLLALLAARARLAAHVRAHPEVREVPVKAPVFVVGMPRTGTTLLHNLLARHPAHRAPALWEMRALARPDGADPAWDATSRAESESVLEVLYTTIPEFRAIHPMNASWPDECSWLFRHNFASMVYAYTYYAPSYVDWLLAADMVPYYEHYKLQLQVIQSQRGAGERLVLKDPCHLWHLDALLKVFPDATVVQLHRPLAEALPSMASLCYALQHVESGRTDPRAMADYCSDLVERGLYPAAWLRSTPAADRFVDVTYAKLVRDPLGGARELCARLGSATDAAAIAPMEAWLRENAQHKAGRHAYTLEQFGFDRARVAQRFGRYEAEFLPPG